MRNVFFVFVCAVVTFGTVVDFLDRRPLMRVTLRSSLGRRFGIEDFITPVVNPYRINVMYSTDNQSLYFTEFLPRSIKSLRKYNPNAIVFENHHNVSMLIESFKDEQTREMFSLSVPNNSQSAHLRSRDAAAATWLRYLDFEYHEISPFAWVLYLDADTVVTESLDELVHLVKTYKWTNEVVMAVKMHNYKLGDKTYFNTSVLASDFGMDKFHKSGFNTGVMVVNIAEWRMQQITEKILAIQYANVADYNSTLYRYDDMAAANIILRDLWVELPPEYNCMNVEIPTSEKDVPYASNGKRCVIVHYTGQKKMESATHATADVSQ